MSPIFCLPYFSFFRECGEVCVCKIENGYTSIFENPWEEESIFPVVGDVNDKAGGECGTHSVSEPQTESWSSSHDSVEGAEWYSISTWQILSIGQLLNSIKERYPSHSLLIITCISCGSDGSAHRHFAQYCKKQAL
jgi:hypothetical protein